MKLFIILVLLLALAAALAFTRPSEADFRAYATQKIERQSSGTLGQILASVQAKTYLSQCTYRNYVLWSVVKRDGRTAYIGLLSHWFDRDAAQDQPAIRSPGTST